MIAEVIDIEEVKNQDVGVQLNTQNAWLEKTIPSGDDGFVSPMNRLFYDLKVFYQNRWTSQFTCKEEMQYWAMTWANAFVENGLSPEEVQYGLASCRQKLDWPPSLPEFIKLCRIDPEQAFYEAIHGLIQRQKGAKGKWSHPAVYWAAVSIGQTDILSATWGQIKSRWESILAITFKVGKWAPIPDPVQSLPPPGKNVTSREEAEKRLKEVSKQIGVVDRNWVKRWEERVARKEITPTVTTLAMVEQAKINLGMKSAPEVTS